MTTCVHLFVRVSSAAAGIWAVISRAYWNHFQPAWKWNYSLMQRQAQHHFIAFTSLKLLAGTTWKNSLPVTLQSWATPLMRLAGQWVGRSHWNLQFYHIDWCEESVSGADVWLLTSSQTESSFSPCWHGCKTQIHTHILNSRLYSQRKTRANVCLHTQAC